MIRLSAFADEADSSLSGQIEALRRNQVGYIELRGINGTNISLVTEDEAKEYAKEKNCGFLMLNVWEFNENAVAFYEKYGFSTRTRHMELKI